MAANYSATIQLIVEGQQKLNQLQNQVNALSKQLKELARLDIGGIFEDPLMGGAVAKLRAVRNEQTAALKQTGQQQDLVNRKLETQLLNQIRLNSAVDLYKRRLNEVSRTAAPEQTQFKGRLQELEQAFQFFKGKGSVAGVQATATELGRIVEYSREVTRLELGRVKSSQQIKDYNIQIEKLKAAGLNTTKAEAVLDKFSVNAGTNKYKLAEKYKILLDSRIKSLNEELRLQKQIAAAESQQGTGFKGRLSSATSSAIIGGGFPLLFGQGAGAAVGGGIGGAAGGLLGGGFGFALSIAGTALGDAIDQAQTFNRSLAVLNASTQQYGVTAQVTADDVKNLAKNLNITKEEALGVLSAFSGFRTADTKNALAIIYGTDASTLENLAAVKDQAGLAEVILSSYKQIGIEKATQLINQLKVTDASSVELAFQKALLDVKIKQTEEGLRQITIQDRIIAGLASVGSLGAGGPVIDPAIFGQQRVEAFRKNNKPQDLLNNALKALQQLRGASRGVEALRPDLGAERASAKAAKDAEREAARVAEVVRDRRASAELIKIESELQDKIAAAESQRDTVLAARLRGEQNILNVQYEYAKTLANERDPIAQTAIIYEGLTKVTAVRRDTEREINRIYEERQRMVQDMITDLDYEIQIKYATTQEERTRIEIERERAKLLKEGITDENVLAAIAARRTELQKPLLGVDIIKQEFGALSEELVKLTDLGTVAVSVAGSISSAFSQAFQGIISGTMTAQEALAAFFKSVGDAFISMAAEIIAKQMTMIILQTILKALGVSGFGGGGGGNPVSNFNLGAAQYGGGLAGGGPARAGTPYLVGERGPELFVPGTSGGVMSNSDLRSAMGPAPGSSGSPVLNMSFETSTINGVEYVSRDQLEAAMAVTRRQAARDGANRGMTMTLDRLQQSPSTRRRVGF